MPHLFRNERNGFIAVCLLGSLLLGNYAVYSHDYRDSSTQMTAVLVYASIAPLVFGIILWCLSDIKSAQSAFLFWLFAAGVYVATVFGNLYLLIQMMANV